MLTDNQTNMQLDVFWCVSDFMWGECGDVLRLLAPLPLSALIVQESSPADLSLVLEEKCLWTQRVCFPLQDHTGPFQSHFSSWGQKNPPSHPSHSPIVRTTVILVILTVCKLTTLVFGEPMRPERGKKMGWKQEKGKSLGVNTKSGQTNLTFNL